MTGPARTTRTRMMVESYEAGPRGDFPSVGKPGHELYRQGACKTCKVSLWGYRPVPRELCGHCAETLL